MLGHGEALRVFYIVHCIVVTGPQEQNKTSCQNYYKLKTVEKKLNHL